MWFWRDYTKPGLIEKKALEIGKGRRKQRIDNRTEQNRQLRASNRRRGKIIGAGVVVIGSPIAASLYFNSDESPKPEATNRTVITEPSDQKPVRIEREAPAEAITNLHAQVDQPRSQATLRSQPQQTWQEPNTQPLKGPPPQYQSRKPAQEQRANRGDLKRRTFSMPVMRPTKRSSMPNAIN